MPYTTEEGGRLNNFASEPRMYTAEAPTKDEKRNSLIIGGAGLLLVGCLMFVAASLSNVS